MELPSDDELRVASLGEPSVPSPLTPQAHFIDEEARVQVCSDLAEMRPFLVRGEDPPAFEPAGPRAQLRFDPQSTVAGIVTCGGLCPGLNNVIRSIVLTLQHAYGCRRVLGFKYGFAGLAQRSADPPIELDLDFVDNIHEHGGTVLGSSRGGQDTGEMVDTLMRHGVNVFFVIGGDGSLRGAHALYKEITRRGENIAIVGVPKTIDNDLAWIEQSFGFSTAVEESQRALDAAHAEAKGAWNGIGLVKLMGRQSGFIAAHASLANSDVNFCLVPEVPFSMGGERGFLRALEVRLARKHHAVIAVAEGAGQELVRGSSSAGNPGRDASGNVRFADVGTYLKDRIKEHFARSNIPVTIKTIDPSYILRSLPANASDAEFALVLGQHAVHAGLAGRTNLVIGSWNQRFTHVPIPLAVSHRKCVDPSGRLWHRVLEALQQPANMQ